MATPTSRRLKVYRAHLGFDDSVVAAPNQGEALKAWGVRQNLFHEGEAGVEIDPKAVSAALEHPGVPLRRPAGSAVAFATKSRPPASLPDIRPPSRRRAKPGPARTPPEPDRSALDAAEADLRRLEKAHAAEVLDLQRRRERLEQDAASLESAWRRTRKAAERRVEQARRAYERTGRG